VYQSVGYLTSLGYLNLKGCWRLKILPRSICDLKSLETLNISGCLGLEKLPSLETLNISGCLGLEKLPYCIGDMESLTKVMVDRIENEQVLSSIGQLKHVRKISLCGNTFYQNSSSSTFWHPPISSLISASALYWKRLMPKAFMDWRLVKSLELSDDGLSDRATNCFDFRGLSSLEELDLSQNKFSSLPSGIDFLPKLGTLSVVGCDNLVSISYLPSNLYHLNALYCKSLKRVRIPNQSKEELLIDLNVCPLLEEIQDIEGPNNIFWSIYVDFPRDSSNNFQKSLVEVLFVSLLHQNKHTHLINF